MIRLAIVMNRRIRIVSCSLAAVLLSGLLLPSSQAKSYSSGGGHSYSSSSSHSSSSGGGHSYGSGSHSFSSGSSHSSSGGSTRSSSSGSSSAGGSRSSSSGGGASKSSSTGSTHSPSSTGNTSKSFSSSSGKSYSASSSQDDDNRRGYSSAKSYTSGAGHTFSSSSGTESATAVAAPAKKPAPVSNPSSFTFDTAAARARKEEASKQDFTRFKDSQLPRPNAPSDISRSTANTPSYKVTPPPVPGSSDRPYRPRVYIPDAVTLSSRPVRIYNVFNPYYSRPVVVYHDPYNSFFWWWLLDRSLDDRAWWTYHHRYDMDPARYEALVANDQQLEARVAQLEAQQAPRDPDYTPPGLDRDLMYSDRHVDRAYSNRATTSGKVAFWLFGIPLAIGASGFFIWLIWFKRWPTTT